MGCSHINTALGANGFSGRIRGSGIIRIVETSENDWNDFVLTWLYFRLIVMWLVMGIRAVWVQKELQKGVKYSVYRWEGIAIFFHLNFSFKREEPFCNASVKRTAALKSSWRFWMLKSSLILLCNYLCKFCTQLAFAPWKLSKKEKINLVIPDMKMTGPLLSAMQSCHFDRHKQHQHVLCTVTSL